MLLLQSDLNQWRPNIVILYYIHSACTLCYVYVPIEMNYDIKQEYLSISSKILVSKSNVQSIKMSSETVQHAVL